MNEASAVIESRFQERRVLLGHADDCLDECELRLDAVIGFFQDPDYRKPSKLMVFGEPKLITVE